MRWERFDDFDALSERAARLLLEHLATKPDSVLALPTGRTPIGLYARVVSACNRETHCFAEATTFNLDEYVGIDSSHPGSYCTYMKRHLLDFVDLKPGNAHIPNGSINDAEPLLEECARYEQLIAASGGLDLAFLGLGRNGHIGFNEPGTPFDSRTRVVELAASTRQANAADFPDGSVPLHAITMGIGTILAARHIVLLASGASKTDAVARLRSGAVGEAFPASALWLHPDVRVLTDVPLEA